MEFKEWLELEMEAQSLSPSALARMAKVPQPTIFRILSGETADPRTTTVKKIERALKALSPPLELPATPLTADEKQTLEFSEYLPPDRLAALIEQVRVEAAQKSALLAALLAKQREDEGRTPQPKPQKQDEWPKHPDRRKSQVKIIFPDRRAGSTKVTTQ